MGTRSWVWGFFWGGGGVTGATNSVFECSVETVWSMVVRCQQDITARKGPTSYGDSNSVQVFSAYTFAAKGAPDWPGEQTGPQEGRFELGCGNTKASGRIQSCTHLVHVFPHLSRSLPLMPLRVDPVCLQNPRKATHGLYTGTRLSFLPATDWTMQGAF